RCFSGCVALSSLRSDLVGTAIFFMGGNGALRMIGGMLYSVNRGRFHCLFTLGQFCDGLITGVFRRRKGLRVSALARTTRAHCPGSVPSSSKCASRSLCRSSDFH